MTRREEASDFIKQLVDTGISMLAIAEKTGVSYNAIRQLSAMPIGRITPTVYTAIRTVYEREMASRTPARIRETGTEYRLTPPEFPVPSSAADMYEQLDFYGGKPDFVDLPEELRDRLKGLQQRLELEIDGIEARYQRTIRAAAEERSAGLEEAVRAYRMRFLDAVMERKK